MPDAHPLRPEDPAELGGNRLLGRLGEGGQGVVYLGRDASGEHVAIKLLHARMAEDPGARDRFVRELSAAKKVARFCTAQVLDADVAGDHPYIVSEFVEGPSLRSQITSEGPRTGGALERLAISTLTALTAIHKAGIVHRDFTPHNVLLGPDGPRVIDFGIARALGATRNDETNSVGTPSYMAPEQVSGKEIGPPADMFAWGSTILFAATGRPPFGNESVSAVMDRIMESEPDVSALPEPLRSVVAACLAKDPAQRPTAQEAQARLVGEDPAEARTPPPAFGVTEGPAGAFGAPGFHSPVTPGLPAASPAAESSEPRAAASSKRQLPAASAPPQFPAAGPAADAPAESPAPQNPQGSPAFHAPALPGGAPFPPQSRPAAATAQHPTVANPTVSNPSVANPTVSNPTVADSSGAQPTAAHPTVAQPTTAQPTVSNPAAPARPPLDGLGPRPWETGRRPSRRPRVGWAVLIGAVVVVAGTAIVVPLWSSGGSAATPPKARAAGPPQTPTPTPTPSQTTHGPHMNGIRSGSAKPAKPKKTAKKPAGCKSYQHVYSMIGTGTVVLNISVCRGTFSGNLVMADTAPKDGWDVCAQMRGHVPGTGPQFVSTAILTTRDGRARSFKDGPDVRFGPKNTRTEDYVIVHTGQCKGSGASAKASWIQREQLAAG